MSAFGMGASFNEPQSNDPTAAPPEAIPSPAQQMAAILSQQKKKKNPRAPAALASAIAKSKRAYQSKRKYG